MKEHELRQMLTLNVHNAKRELRKFVNEWEKTVRKDVKVTQKDVDDFKEVVSKVNQLSSEFENAFLEYQIAKQQFEERKKMETHKFNPESVRVLSKLYNELDKGDYALKNYSEEENNIEFLNEDLNVTDIIQFMEEFLAILKK